MGSKVVIPITRLSYVRVATWQSAFGIRLEARGSYNSTPNKHKIGSWLPRRPSIWTH